MIDMEISSLHAENKRHRALIERKKIQRSDQFLMSRSSVILKFILDSRFKSPLSYPEAQIVTWMSYDTEIQKNILKKLMHAGRESRATHTSIGNDR